MSHKTWESADTPGEMIDILARIAPDDGEDSQTVRKLRLFKVACCNRIMDLIVYSPSQEAVHAAEHFADKTITTEDYADLTILASEVE